MAPYCAFDLQCQHSSHDDAAVAREAEVFSKDAMLAKRHVYLHGHWMEFRHLMRKMAHCGAEGQAALEPELDLLIARVKADIAAHEECGDTDLHDILNHLC